MCQEEKDGSQNQSSKAQRNTNNLIWSIIILSMLASLIFPATFSAEAAAASQTSDSACIFTVSTEQYTHAGGLFFEGDPGDPASSMVNVGTFERFETPEEYVDPSNGQREILISSTTPVNTDRINLNSELNGRLILKMDPFSRDPTAVMVDGLINGYGTANGRLYSQGPYRSELAEILYGYTANIVVEAQDDVLVYWTHSSFRIPPASPRWQQLDPSGSVMLQAGETKTLRLATPNPDRSSLGLPFTDIYMVGSIPFTDIDLNDTTYESLVINCQRIPECAPQIQQVQPYGAPYLGMPYSMSVTIYLPETCPYDSYDFTLTIEENPALTSDQRTFDRGDRTNSVSQYVTGVQPGIPKEVLFVNKFVHDWDWTNKGTESCLSTAIKDHVEGWLQGLAIDSIFEDILADASLLAYDITSYIGDLVDQDIIYKNKYGYRVSLTGRDVIPIFQDFSNSVEVKVPDYLREAYFKYLIGMVRAGLWTTVGESILEKYPQLVVGAAGAFAAEALETGFAVAHCNRAVRRSGSPTMQALVTASDYHELATPEDISLPSLDAITDSAGKQLSYATVDALRFYDVIAISLERHNAALAAEDAEWAASQLQHAREYLALYQQATVEIETLTNQLVADFIDNGVSLDGAAIQDANDNLASNGLPQLERDILSELGWTGDDIDSIESAVPDILAPDDLDWFGVLSDSATIFTREVDVIAAQIDEFERLDEPEPPYQVFLPMIGR